MSGKHKISQAYLNLTNLNNTRYLDAEDENLSFYLKDIRQYNQLPWDEELELIIKYQKRQPGYQEAKDKVLGSHQKFVVMAAKRYRPLEVNICDLISEANIGLNVALDRFDTTKETKFITFASRYIIKYIFEFLENNCMVYQPNRSKVHGAIDRITEKFFAVNGYYPNIEELQSEFIKMGVLIKDKTDLIDIMVEPLEGYVNDDDEPREFGEWDMIEERIDSKLLQENLKQALQSLTKIERTVIIKKFGLDGFETSLPTLAIEMGMSVEELKPIINRAIAKLRKKKSLFV